MLKLTQNKREEIIERCVAVYGEEYRERITKKIMEAPVVFTYKNKHETAIRAIDEEINKVPEVRQFLEENLESISYADFELLKAIGRIALRLKYSEFTTKFHAEQMVFLGIEKFSKILGFPEDFKTYTEKEKEEYVKQHIKEIGDLIKAKEDLWNNSEAKKLVEDKLKKRNFYNEKAEETKEALEDVEDKIKQIVRAHLEKLSRNKKYITNSHITDFLKLSTMGWDAISSYDWLMEKVKSFCNDLGFKINVLNKMFLESILFPKKLLNEIIRLQEEKYNLVLENSSFEQNFKQISQIPMENGNQFVAEGLFDFATEVGVSSTMAYAHTYIDGETKDVSNVIVIPDDSDVATIVHEFGHQIQSQVLERVGNTTVYRSGLCVSIVVSGRKNYKSKEEVIEAGKTKRKGESYYMGPDAEEINQRYYDLMDADFTPLNEALNEYFTIEACKNSKIKEKSKYIKAFYMLKDFIEAYRTEIIKCLMGGDLLEFVDLVGEQNLIDLNEKVRELFKNSEVVATNARLEKLEKLSKQKGVRIENLFSDEDIEEIKEKLKQNKQELEEKGQGYLIAEIEITIEINGEMKTIKIDQRDIEYIEFLKSSKVVVDKIVRKKSEKTQGNEQDEYSEDSAIEM